jgi:hypothetical protein
VVEYLPSKQGIRVRFPCAAHVKKPGVILVFSHVRRKNANCFAFVGNRKPERCLCSDSGTNREAGPRRNDFKSMKCEIKSYATVADSSLAPHKQRKRMRPFGSILFRMFCGRTQGNRPGLAKPRANASEARIERVGFVSDSRAVFAVPRKGIEQG